MRLVGTLEFLLGFRRAHVLFLCAHLKAKEDSMVRRAVFAFSLFVVAAVAAQMVVPGRVEAAPTIGYCSVSGYVNPYSVQSVRVQRMKGNSDPSSRSRRVAPTMVEYEDVVLYYFALEQWDGREWEWRNVAWAVEVHADHMQTVRDYSWVTVSGQCAKDGDLFIIVNPTGLIP